PLPNFRALRAGGPDVEWEGRNIPKAGANFAAPFETASPSFTGLMYAPILRRPAVVTVVPVFRERQPVYALSLVYSSRFFDELLRAERDPGVTTAILDQRGVFIARNPDSERFVGRVGPAPFDHGAAQLPRAGVGEGLNVESIPVVYAFSRSEVTDYVVAAGMPRSAVLAPAWRALWLSLGVLLSAGALGTVFAFRLWRRVGTPLTALAEQARSLGESHGEIAATGIDEVDALRTPLATLACTRRGCHGCCRAVRSTRRA
ncbi:MAG: hypothetical protein ACJ79R_22975, partial [Anaeromyxobacteraceae bacterium]